MEFDGRAVRIRDSKGMTYLARLLAEPDRETPALALVREATAEPAARAHAADSGLVAVADSDAGPLLDSAARAAYRDRLQELREERDEAEAFHDPERAARARMEYDALVHELASATGLGGRDRRAGSHAERARLNATRAIKSAIRRIAEHDAPLGQYLGACVKTGRICLYEPDPEAPVNWRVSMTAPSRYELDIPRPPTRFARSGEVNIAHQVIGTGPDDIIFVPGFLCNLDYTWADPVYRNFLLRLASSARLIMFDKRGAGLSDPVGAAPTLEERADDISTVMDAVGSRRAALLGYSEGVSIAATFAATQPERVSALVALSSYPTFGPAADGQPWGGELAELSRRGYAATERWGEGETLEIFAPSLAGDEGIKLAWGAFERASMSPAMARAMLDWINTIDVRPVLGSVRVPTLVLHRRDECVPLAAGRAFAGMIPGALFVELPGSDHAPIAGDMGAVVDEIEHFLATCEVPSPRSRVLATIAHIRTGDAPPVSTLRERIPQLGGREITFSTTGIHAAFDGPAQAVRASREILDALRGAGGDARAGIHTGECDLIDDTLEGPPLLISEGLSSDARAGEVLVTRTVKDLVLGAELEFADRGERRFDGIAGELQVHAAYTPSPMHEAD